MHENILKENLKGVNHTLFIPLVARSYVSKRFPNYFFDNIAIKIDEKLPQKMIKEKSNEYNMMASVARYVYMDKLAINFINTHKNCNVINLGCGLETQYHRLDIKPTNYYNIDLDNVIELRNRILEKGENEINIACDIFNLTWYNQIDTSLPSLILSSGVFMYFEEYQILTLLKSIQENFEYAELIFDITNKKGLNYANKYVKKTGNLNAMMHFYVDDGLEFTKKIKNSKLIEVSPFFTEALKIKGLSIGTKLFMKLADDLERTKILHIKL